MKYRHTALTPVVLALVCASLSVLDACGRGAARTFPTPEDAVESLIAAARTSSLDAVVAIFGVEGRAVVDSSDPATPRRNLAVFTAAAAERWHLEAQPDASKLLVIGNEDWPFPVPLVKDARGWRFDAAAGNEEILARRIGRNELAVIGVCRTYVAAQRLYRDRGHDGNAAGFYAMTLRSDPGRQNGLYWPASAGQKRSPLGDLVAQAAADGRTLGVEGKQPSPFHGYYFRILTAQGPGARGGAKDYISDGKLSGGFALVAWPSVYGATGIMTFMVNQEGLVYERDLGTGTEATVQTLTSYDPGPLWTAVQ